MCNGCVCVSYMLKIHKKIYFHCYTLSYNFLLTNNFLLTTLRQECSTSAHTLTRQVTSSRDMYAIARRAHFRSRFRLECLNTRKWKFRLKSQREPLESTLVGKCINFHIWKAKIYVRTHCIVLKETVRQMHKLKYGFTLSHVKYHLLCRLCAHL